MRRDRHVRGVASGAACVGPIYNGEASLGLSPEMTLGFDFCDRNCCVCATAGERSARPRWALRIREITRKKDPSSDTFGLRWHPGWPGVG